MDKSKYVDGVIYSWDYDEIIEDLEQDVLCGDYRNYIQVLRMSEPVFGDYRPIIDYYYVDEVMKSICEISILDEGDDIIAKSQIKESYLRDKPHLELMEVQKVLEEMKKMNKIL